MENWITELIHHQCAGCEACARAAITTAQVTGSTGASHADANHGARVERELCAWFALCDRPSTSVRQHPILGDVPICERCDAKVSAIESSERGATRAAVVMLLACVAILILVVSVVVMAHKRHEDAVRHQSCEWVAQVEGTDGCGR